MLLPSLRKRLRTVSGKNQSLQDILRTLNDSTEILSIQSQLRGIHNTSIVLKVDLGDNHEPSTRYDTRVHFYNRLPLANVLVGLDYTGTTIEQIIAKLNIQGCDFNEDDLEVVSDYLCAKETSLGYIGRFKLTSDAPVNPDTNKTNLQVWPLNSEEQFSISPEFVDYWNNVYLVATVPSLTNLNIIRTLGVATGLYPCGYSLDAAQVDELVASDTLNDKVIITTTDKIGLSEPVVMGTTLGIFKELLVNFPMINGRYYIPASNLDGSEFTSSLTCDLSTDNNPLQPTTANISFATISNE